MNKKDQLKARIFELQDKLRHLEGGEAAKITELLIESDLGDDFRENEAAKLAMETQRMWQVRQLQLKKEILELKKKLHALVE